MTPALAEMGVQPTKTARYRRVAVKTWGDAKFQALSSIPACGQGLWLYLLTGTFTGPIPGLCRAGRAAMAEDLDWTLEDFDKAFQEVLAQGMALADFKARVVWIPKAINYNPPASPNVVKSWGSEFHLIPECDLKRIAFNSLKSSVHALGKAFEKAFDETLTDPAGMPSGNSLPKTMANQEQEYQEQDREQQGGSPPIPPSAAAPVDPAPTGRKPRIALADRNMPIPDWLPAEPWRAFEETRWAKHTRAPYTLRAQEGLVKKLRDLLDQKHDLTQVLEASVRSGWADVFAPRGSTGVRSNGAPAPLSLAGARTLENATRLAERLFSQEGTSHET